MMWPDALMAMTNMENNVQGKNMWRTEGLILLRKVNFEFNWELDEINDNNYMCMQTSSMCIDICSADGRLFVND